MTAVSDLDQGHRNVFLFQIHVEQLQPWQTSKYQPFLEVNPLMLLSSLSNLLKLEKDYQFSKNRLFDYI